MSEIKQVKIEITGLSNTGKTALAEAIAQFLMSKDIWVEINDPDIANGSGRSVGEQLAVFAVLAETCKVTIETHQENRKPIFRR